MSRSFSMSHLIRPALGASMLLAAAAVAAHGHGHGHGSHDAAAAAAAAAAAGPVSTDVTAQDCWIRSLPAPTPSGGYAVLRNEGAQALAVTGASSPDYGMVMLHQTTEENGLSKMSMVHEAAIPAGQSLELKPGGFHIMLEQPRAGLKVGDHAHVVFHLANGQTVPVDCELKPAKAMSH